MVSPTGRLAPSPTGELHVGHARSFLLAWWSARARGGRVVLRIEDLDRDRVKPGAIETVLCDLAWLGPDWDGEPLHQSAETGPLADAVEALLEEGLAYPCVCSRREIRAARSAPQEGVSELRYPGTCRDRFDDLATAERESGVAAGIRLRVPPGPRALEDGFVGRFEADVAAEVGDFLLARRDGAFAYQLAVVVDDARQGIDEVVRGEDLLPSAARQHLLQEALGLPHPTWFHVPLVVDEDGERLAKRRGDLSLRHLRESGVDPRAVVAWAARSAGLDVGERVEAAACVAGFDMARVPRERVVFGEQEMRDLVSAKA